MPGQRLRGKSSVCWLGCSVGGSRFRVCVSAAALLRYRAVGWKSVRCDAACSACLAVGAVALRWLANPTQHGLRAGWAMLWPARAGCGTAVGTFGEVRWLPVAFFHVLLFRGFALAPETTPAPFFCHVVCRVSRLCGLVCFRLLCLCIAILFGRQAGPACLLTCLCSCCASPSVVGAGGSRTSRTSVSFFGWCAFVCFAGASSLGDCGVRTLLSLPLRSCGVGSACCHGLRICVCGSLLSSRAVLFDLLRRGALSYACLSAPLWVCECPCLLARCLSALCLGRSCAGLRGLPRAAASLQIHS